MDIADDSYIKGSRKGEQDKKNIKAQTTLVSRTPSSLVLLGWNWDTEAKDEEDRQDYGRLDINLRTWGTPDPICVLWVAE